MSQLNGMVLIVQFTRLSRVTRVAMISRCRFRGRRDGDIDANGVVVGFELLALVGNRVDGNVSWAGIGAGVAWDEPWWLKEDIGLVMDDAG